MDLIHSPTLLIDLDKVGQNVARMTNKTMSHGLTLSAHAKTHQSGNIACLLRQQGMESITVSSPQMARYFASLGWKQIHMALPPIDAMLPLLDDLAHQALFSVNISQPAHIQTILKLKAPVSTLIEIDTGQGRSGIPIDQHDEVHVFVEHCLSQGIDLRGYYVHNGLSYYCQSKEEILNVHHKALAAISLLPTISPCGHEVWFGDTPGCSTAQDFTGITTLTAGNFVFYDIQQQLLGSCTLGDIAVCMACRIIEKRGTNQLLVHGGAVHFGKDSLRLGEGQVIYGKVVELHENGWELGDGIGHLVALWQEHGMLTVNPEFFRKTKVGQLIGVLPVHSCHTAAAMGSYLSTNGLFVPSIRNWPH
ncbi:MAG: alanine racemase [Bacteroidetes bacterium]|nr:alanine racemase [Bacteroidota bacterium]